MCSKVGVLFGKFLPLHNGHLNMILKAYTEVDRLYVVLCHSSRDDTRTPGIPHMSKQLRLKWLHQCLKDFDNIRIVDVCEEDIPEYPNGWKWFVELLKQAVPEEFHTVFTSEYQYDEPLRTLLPGIQHYLVDPKRSLVSISATDIVRDPLKHWDHIPKVVRPTFVKKVVLVGTESCGKTTLAKTLAQYFNTVCVEEYGKQYVLDHLGACEESLQYDDYLQIALGHKQKEYAAAMEANKVMIIDTEATVTQYYCHLYTGNFHPTVSEIMRQQHYDLWLFTAPDVPWVSDGLRNTSDTTLREERSGYLKEMIREHSSLINMHPIDGDFPLRLQSAIETIDRVIF